MAVFWDVILQIYEVNPEDGGSVFLRNVNFLLNYTALTFQKMELLRFINSTSLQSTNPGLEQARTLDISASAATLIGIFVSKYE
jgi:hypothetical protein